MQNEAITLVTIVSALQSGFKTEISRTETEVMAEKKSVTYKEFYEAQRNSLNVSMIVKLNVDDYDSAIVMDGNVKYRPTIVIYDDVEYRIVRAYQTSKVKIELTLQEVE